MILLIRRRQIVLAVLICCAVLGVSAVLWQENAAYMATFATLDGQAVTVVVDPGHGGEDGGAVSPGGVEESSLNLAVAQSVRDLLCLAGQATVMTRTEDVSIHDAEAGSAREKKISDIHNRTALVNETPGAVLVSIHQNSLPSSPVTHGAQVFWNRQEGAEALAAAVQNTLNQAVNAGNEKHTRRIPDSIYLMNHAASPAILVECGFLSNEEETVQLQTPAYQRRLAAAIAAGFLSGITGED